MAAHGTWNLNDGNTLTLVEQPFMRGTVVTKGWEVLERDATGELVQRRRYATDVEAMKWIDGVLGTQDELAEAKAQAERHAIQLPAERREQVEEIKRQYRAAATPSARIAVLNDGTLGSPLTRTFAAIELHDAEA